MDRVSISVPSIMTVIHLLNTLDFRAIYKTLCRICENLWKTAYMNPILLPNFNQGWFGGYPCLI